MARSGLYVQLDVNFPDDEKVIAVGLDGAGLYAMSLCVAKRLMSDGRLTRVHLRRLGAPDDLVDRLIAGGLFVPDGDDAVIVAAWLAHNDSVSRIEERRASDAARKRVSRAKRPDGHADTSAPRPDGLADTEEKSREEKRREDVGASNESNDTRRRRGTPAPDIFGVSEQMRSWAATKGIIIDLDAETERFLDHHRAKGSKFQDWLGAWRNWMRKAQQYAERDGRVGRPQLAEGQNWVER